MGNSSSIADPTAADGRYMSKESAKVTRLKDSEMATTMDTQMPPRDDLNLMGLQELDSHLSIFESSNPGRDSSTPGAMSNSPFGDSINTAEQQTHTIVVESPGENVPYKSPFGVGSRARFTDQKYNHVIPYVLFLPCHDLSFNARSKSFDITAGSSY
jgi:hypothetical protein